MCRAAKRATPAEALPDCLAKQLIASIPHNTYLYLCRSNREPVCCARALFGACNQCDAVRTHAVMLWPCLRAVRSPACEGDEAGRSSFVLTVNSILDLHLHMQQDDDYEPVYSGSSIAEAHRARAAWARESADHW
jgi:hypothetical protein